MSWGEALPAEVIELILEQVDDELTRTCCRFVCRQWNDLLVRLAWRRTRICPPEDDDDDDEDDDEEEEEEEEDGEEGEASLSRVYKAAIRWLAAPDDFCARAAGAGYLSVVQWARANGCPWSQLTCAAAAEGGHLRLLQWLRGEPEDDALEAEMERHDDQVCPWDEITCRRAAAGGHLDLLRWAYDHGCPLGQEELLCRAAARGGHLRVLQLLRFLACAWDSDTILFAAKEGRLDVVVWARLHGCAWEAPALEEAVKNGHLEVAKWLAEQGCPRMPPDRPRFPNSLPATRRREGSDCGPVDDLTLAEAAKRGHVEVLRWAYERGYVPDRTAIERAVEAGQVEVLQWLSENTAAEVWKEVREPSFFNAMLDDHVDVLKWAIQSGIPGITELASDLLEEGWGPDQ